MEQIGMGCTPQCVASHSLYENAGPFALAIDLMFEAPETCRGVEDSGAVTPTVLSRRYGMLPEDIRFVCCESPLAIKFNIPRPIASGDRNDGEVFGGQRYAPVLSLGIG